jgi:rubredoxin
MPSYTCPNCGTDLQRKEPIPAGKKMKCPVCAHIFAPVAVEAPAADEDLPIKLADEPEPPKPAAPAAASSSSKAKGGKGPPPPPVKAQKDVEEEEDDRKDYGVVQEKEEEDGKKPEISYGSLRDKFAKSKIGPAQYITVKPSNWLLRLGLFSCIMGLFMAVVACWPIIFSLVPPPRVFIRPAMNVALIGFAQFCCGAFICYGASKLQDLTSFPIALAGSIVACLFYTPFCIIAGLKLFTLMVDMLGPTGYPTAGMVTVSIVAMAGVGYWCIATLFNPAVREGFAERKLTGVVER